MRNTTQVINASSMPSLCLLQAVPSKHLVQLSSNSRACGTSPAARMRSRCAHECSVRGTRRRCLLGLRLCSLTFEVCAGLRRRWILRPVTSVGPVPVRLCRSTRGGACARALGCQARSGAAADAARSGTAADAARSGTAADTAGTDACSSRSGPRSTSQLRRRRRLRGPAATATAGAGRSGRGHLLFKRQAGPPGCLGRRGRCLPSSSTCDHPYSKCLVVNTSVDQCPRSFQH
mmetsp:Transcript_83613/g.245150  ORF Transcript_83613/g.245150 Transcript_83613/m.245150 type:complete len:233 (+) Transcript_83613:612-1310(+)